MEPQLSSLHDVALSSTRIAEPLSLRLPDRVWHSNLADTNPKFAQHMREFVYHERVANLAAIDLLQLPTETVVYGGGHFITAFGNRFIQEQYPPYAGSLSETVSELAAVPRPTHIVEGEMLLIGRFGVSTWGHWIGELLPKILLTEELFPDRFRYILPSAIAGGDRSSFVWGKIAESLQACGVEPDRVCGLDAGAHHRFERLFAVSPVWSDYMIHPAAGEALRRRVGHIQPEGPTKLAVIRAPRFQRMLANADEIYGMLKARGFETEATGLLPFRTQVARFKAARTVFCVLGSDLTNLVFSPEGISLISIAPDIFGDRFFYGLILDRRGRMADLRGPIVIRGAVDHKSAFRVDAVAAAGVLDQHASNVSL